MTGAARRLLAGSYTDGAAGGIFTLAFDEAADTLRVVREDGHAPNPSYLALRGRRLYVAHELDDRSCLAAYRFEDDGSLACCGACSSPADAGTCFAAVHPDGRRLYGANYLSGSVGICLLAADGSPCGGLPPMRHEGTGPVRGRQDGPHVHSMGFVPGTNLLAAVDLGTDSVTLYRAEPTGALGAPPAGIVRVPAGSGPRMLAFHPRLRLAALVDELANDVLLFRFDRTGLAWERAGRLELPVAPGDVRAAQPAFSPDGRFLYVSVRGTDRIARFAFEEEGRVRGARRDFPSGGRGPRHISLSPDGRFLAAANQDDGCVVLFAVDAASGALREAARCAAPQASCAIWG